MKAPFPYFGGKSAVAGEVWRRFGEPRNYIEPFFGSGAVLLHREKPVDVETVNDRDGMVVNFWRAVQEDWAAVLQFANQPVFESDLHAWHKRLIALRPELTQELERDPFFYDTEIAGRWVWGQRIYIGRNFTARFCRAIPQLGNTTQIDGEQLRQLAERLRKVRVVCGDWKRVTSPTVTTAIGLTAVFLDPPYESEHRSDTYALESYTVASEVRAWCAEVGTNVNLRIALCGYEGEHNALEDAGWARFEWSTSGGMGNRSPKKRTDTQGRENARLERIWFSPGCLNATEQLGLFGEAAHG